MLNSCAHFNSKAAILLCIYCQLFILRLLCSKVLFVQLNLTYQCFSGLFQLRIKLRDVLEVKEFYVLAKKWKTKVLPW